MTNTNSNINILFVDDDEQIRHLAAAVLRRQGYHVDLAESGMKALEYLKTTSPDVIVSDVMMPDMDGFSLLKQIRHNPNTAKIPLILLTALADADNVVEGLSLGADDYIKKPFTPSELVARIRSKIERPPIPNELIIKDIKTGLPRPAMFNEMSAKELFRSRNKGADGYVAYLSLSELPILQERLGAGISTELWKQVTRLIEPQLRPLDVIGWAKNGLLGFILPESNEAEVKRLLSVFIKLITNNKFTLGNEHLNLTPSIGFSNFRSAENFEELDDHVHTALEIAIEHLDLQPLLYESKMGIRAGRKKTSSYSVLKEKLQRIYESLRLPLQFTLTIAIGFLFPLTMYLWLDAQGKDISDYVYIVIVFALLLTAVLIWAEGFLATRAVDPPAEPLEPYPPASAIIAAYLPNEAPTILDTIKSFLKLEYPAPLQIILAYNTPHELPIEEHLRQLAKENPGFIPLKIENSTSKAQNVNKALQYVTGTFVGVFDADHHPEPDSFTRAWRWLSNGNDVVQGHCVVRNGDASWVSKTVAVEFEAIYAVSHPGRAILHKFGIFGGSNGFWKTDLLRKTRMHGTMLTEDIDSSIRVLTAGSRIKSDPRLISRELAPTSLQSLWNQRLRWAQGWLQVSLRHLFKALVAKNLTVRQKFGLLWLLGWREIYPWISMQMFPIILFWIIKYGGVEKINWLIPIFVLTTLFTLSVAPGQVFFAYRLGDHEVKTHKNWFFFYLFISSIFYVEFKNIIARVAQIKELFKERSWKVTPRMTPKKA